MEIAIVNSHPKGEGLREKKRSSVFNTETAKVAGHSKLHGNKMQNCKSRAIG